ncbi:MAG: SpoIIE family protein phosphatase, partial [Bacteroidales bacterium]|nr:SpoIIE family protein phosphatase [Bacteroidales bacterium]
MILSFYPLNISLQIPNKISRSGRSFSRFTLLFVFLISFNHSIFSQPIFEKGYLSILNYTTEDYKKEAQNFAIIQDKRGVMYFGNNRGVLEYDGKFWRPIDIKEKPVFSLAIDENGKIFVGSMNEFGYLAPDSVGNLQYHSLIQYLNENDKNFGDVWKTFATSEGVYFQTSGAIFRWDADSIRVWTSENEYHFSFFVNGEFFVREKETGLKIMKEDTLILLNTGKKFDTLDIYGMVPYSKNEALIVTDKHGIYHLYNTDKPNETRIVTYFTVIDNFLDENAINNVIKIDDHKYSFGTWGSGVILFDQSTGQFEVINKISGLQDEIVNFQFLDDRGNLWLALSDGITMAAVGSPVTFYKDNTGLDATIESITRFNNHLCVATHLGSLYLTHLQGLNIPPIYYSNAFDNKPGFVQIGEVASESWGLLSFELKNEKFLLVILNDKVVIIDKDNKVCEKIYNSSWDVYQSKQDPSRVFIGIDEGLESIYRKNGEWIKEGKTQGINERIYKITEDPSGKLWMGTNNGSVYVMNITNFNLVKENPKVIRYDTTHGLPEGDIYVELVNDKPLFATGKGLYTFLPGQERFEPDTTYGMEFADGSRYIHRLSQDHDGYIWMVTYLEKTKEYETGFLKPLEGGGYRWIKEPFLSFSKGVIHAIHHDEGGVTWLGGVEGLYRYDSRVEKNFSQDYYTLIRKVALRGDSAIFMGAFFDNKGVIVTNQPESLIPIFRYADNSLTFEFSALNNEDEIPVLFSYYLEGYDKKWSDWSTEFKKEYTNLHEKTYKFHVKSKNLYEHEGKKAVYTFTILPPWHRTILAYIGYVLFFIGFVYTVVTVYTRGLRAIIRERTAEIREQKDEIEEKNRDIVASIQYASRIQTALLPPGDYIKELFPERFILFLPRDIVSGDYYWMTKKNNKIFTVTADCTGHGVPGAFMSMLGVAFLNEITSKVKDIHANEILDQLRDQVVKSLRQTGETGESQDGMDLALYILDTEKMKLEFAGANNPLFLFRNKELEVIKPDKMPIGISMKIDLPFTNHVIDVKKGDLL